MVCTIRVQNLKSSRFVKIGNKTPISPFIMIDVIRDKLCENVTLITHESEHIGINTEN
jgi:hypothetical protein